MRYLFLEKRWTDKRWFDLVVVTALFLLYPIIKIKSVMISHTATMTSQISESEKEDRSSMEIVIIESPPFRYVVCVSPGGQASTIPSLLLFTEK